MRWLHSLTFLFTVLLFAACGPRNARVAPALPTNTPVPTFTATPVGAAPAASSSQTGSQTQVQPAATSAPPGATAAPELPMVTIGNVLMNVRGGPGTNYHVIGTASPGQRFAITGKNPVLGDWWQIDYNGETGWVYGPLVTATNANSVQVALVIPAPPPPTATPIPPTLVPAPTQPPAPRFPYSLSSQGNCPYNREQTFFEGSCMTGITILRTKFVYTLHLAARETLSVLDAVNLQEGGVSLPLEAQLRQVHLSKYM